MLFGFYAEYRICDPLLIVELLILELGNKVAIYVIEVPDPLGTRSVPVRLYPYGDRTSIESRSK